MNRIHNLDYLRGLAALGIMIFHYLSWTLGEFESNTIIGRIGIYGVSIFYILSGLTLYHVYHNNLGLDKKSFVTFFKKRLFRIFPLLWLVTLSSILLFSLKPHWIDLILNFTGLFGVFKWSTYLATGAWSIGNELSFYLFFPFYLWLLKNNKLLARIIYVLVFLVYVFFAFRVLNTEQTLSQNWHNYVNPLNQLFLFASGMLMGHFFNNFSRSVIFIVSILLFGIMLFVFYPALGDTIKIVTGVNRLIFTFSAVLICFGFYKLNWEAPHYLHEPLKKLGDASYSVYLLHPLL
jgi:peptidoglycan/LPS O-acetylase OafA/YrhL